MRASPSFSLPAGSAIRVAAASLVIACGGGNEAPGDASSATPEAVTLATVPEPVQLSENDVEHWLAAAGELKALGVGMEKDQGDSPSDLSATMAAWQANSEVMAILRKHEFDLNRFHRVTYSVMMAAAAEGVSQQGDEMAQAKQKLEAMKSQLPAGTYESMVKAQEQADSMRQAIMNQPPGNVELVRRYRERIEAIGR